MSRVAAFKGWAPGPRLLTYMDHRRKTGEPLPSPHAGQVVTSGASVFSCAPSQNIVM
jgi:hypothetical protein